MRRIANQRWWWLAALALVLAGDQAAPVVAQNQAYAQACGQCHMVFHPGLLPRASWHKLLEGRSQHFGESLPLSQAKAGEIQGFLEANAADRSGDKRSRKIMASLGRATPLRPSQVPYLVKKHHDITAEVFARPAVGGLFLLNQLSLHPSAPLAPR